MIGDDEARFVILSLECRFDVFERILWCWTIWYSCVRCVDAFTPLTELFLIMGSDVTLQVFHTEWMLSLSRSLCLCFCFSLASQYTTIITNGHNINHLCTQTSYYDDYEPTNSTHTHIHKVMHSLCQSGKLTRTHIHIKFWYKLSTV